MYPRIDEPLAKGASQDTAKLVVVALCRLSAGVEGAPLGVMAGVNTDKLLPASLNVSIRMTYGVPLVSPVISVGEVSKTPGVHSVKDVALDVLYKTFALAADVHETVKEPLPPTAITEVAAAGAVFREMLDSLEHVVLAHALKEKV